MNLVEFFRNFGIEPNQDYKPLTIRQLELIVKVAQRWYGEGFAAIVLDCFMPCGEVIDPGFEDSYSHYQLVQPFDS
jgi:hypothetical protein